MSEKWYKVLFKFWNDNLLQNVKKISIGFGSFLIVVITTCTMPTHLFLASMYGAGITFGTIAIMSIFGKNGNGGSESVPPQPEPETKTEIPDKLFGTAADNSIKTEIKEAVIKAEVITRP